MKKKVHHVKILARCGMLRHAAACCGMLRHASKPPSAAPKNRRCGMLRHAAACCGMLRHAAAALACTRQGSTGGVFHALENLRLQVLGRQNLCHLYFLEMSEQGEGGWGRIGGGGASLWGPGGEVRSGYMAPAIVDLQRPLLSVETFNSGRTAGGVRSCARLCPKPWPDL